MEAVVFCVYAIGEPILEKRTIELIYVTGGFAQNDLWVQILSDIFNLPVKVSETIENAAWGATKLGIESLHLDPPAEEKIVKTFRPSPEHHLIYRQLFKKSERLYAELKQEF